MVIKWQFKEHLHGHSLCLTTCQKLWNTSLKHNQQFVTPCSIPDHILYNSLRLSSSRQVILWINISICAIRVTINRKLKHTWQNPINKVYTIRHWQSDTTSSYLNLKYRTHVIGSYSASLQSWIFQTTHSKPQAFVDTFVVELAVELCRDSIHYHETEACHGGNSSGRWFRAMPRLQHHNDDLFNLWLALHSRNPRQIPHEIINNYCLWFVASHDV